MKLLLRYFFSKENINEAHFPYKTGVDRKKLKTIDSTHYSITKPHHTKQVIKVMKKYINNLKNNDLTEICANVGGDTISFAENFKKVLTFEVDENAIECLGHNLKMYKLDKNVEIICKGFDTNDMINTEYVYIDPPWSNNVQEGSNQNIIFNNVGIFDFLESIIHSNKNIKNVFVKLPPNHILPEKKGIKMDKYLLEPRKNVMIVVLSLNLNKKTEADNTGIAHIEHKDSITWFVSNGRHGEGHNLFFSTGKHDLQKEFPPNDAIIIGDKTGSYTHVAVFSKSKTNLVLFSGGNSHNTKTNTNSLLYSFDEKTSTLKLLWEEDEEYNFSQRFGVIREKYFFLLGNAGLVFYDFSEEGICINIEKSLFRKNINESCETDIKCFMSAIIYDDNIIIATRGKCNAINLNSPNIVYNVKNCNYSLVSNSSNVNSISVELFKKRIYFGNGGQKNIRQNNLLYSFKKKKDDLHLTKLANVKQCESATRQLLGSFQNKYLIEINDGSNCRIYYNNDNDFYEIIGSDKIGARFCTMFRQTLVIIGYESPYFLIYTIQPSMFTRY